MNKLIKSFGWAMNGVLTVWREEVNFRIELCIGVVAVAFGFYFKLEIIEWVIIVGLLSLFLPPRL